MCITRFNSISIHIDSMDYEIKINEGKCCFNVTVHFSPWIQSYIFRRLSEREFLFFVTRVFGALKMKHSASQCSMRGYELTVYIMWCERGKIFVASWIEAAASEIWSSERYISASNSHTCNCNNQARWGPGLWVYEEIEEATSDRACSTRDAANECACRESKQ